MKPDSYMPFYGNDFFQAVEGWPSTAIEAYLRAIWNYWHHNHCRGLEDNDDSLRRICRVDKEDWESVRSRVFDNEKFFMQDAEGRWHQKRAEDLWNDAKIKYGTAVKRAKAGAKARWQRRKRTMP